MMRRTVRPGYSLIEVIITLVILALVTGLLFEGVGGAARLSLRLSDAADLAQRRMIGADWIRETIAAALPGAVDPDAPGAPPPVTLRGAATRLELVTASSLHRYPGSPRAITWRIAREGAQSTLIYEADAVKWEVAHSVSAGAGFTFQGEDGAWRTDWRSPEPPRLIALVGMFPTPVIAAPRARSGPVQPPSVLKAF